MEKTDKPVDRRVLRTKRAIKAAFARLLTEKDVNDITISDIADLADINRKTFYNYYAGIYEVIDEIEDEIAANFETVLTDTDFKENLKNPYMLFEKLTEIINTDMDFFGYMLSMNANVSLSTKIVEILKTRAKTIIMSYLDEDERRIDLMLEFMISGLMAVYKSWFNSDRRDNIEDLNEEISVLSFRGVNGYLNMDLYDVG